jgi:hypothetical protein
MKKPQYWQEKFSITNNNKIQTIDKDKAIHKSDLNCFNK